MSMHTGPMSCLTTVPPYLTRVSEKDGDDNGFEPQRLCQYSAVQMRRSLKLRGAIDTEYSRAYQSLYADSPRFSLSEKKMIIRHNFLTKTSASSSSA